MQVVISIIIPVYCAERYLERCLNSVINQSFHEWELILIDDGSTDLSGDICDMYSNKDSRIFVIHQNNSGVSHARNVGISKATGKYITFVDADDWLDKDYCESLVTHMEKDVSLVISGYKWIGANRTVNKSILNTISMDIKQVREKFDLLYKLDILNPPFGKLYKKDMIEDLKFETSIQLGEDLIFNLEYMEKSEKIVFVSNNTYNYNVMNETSATKKLRKSDFNAIILHYEKAKKFKYGNQTDLILNQYDEIDKRLCTNGIGLIQLAYYKDLNKANNIVSKWLENSDFYNSCYGQYEMPLHLQIPKFFCKHKLIHLLQLFYLAKYSSLKIRKIGKGWKNKYES